MIYFLFFFRYRSKSKDADKCDAKDSRLCIIGFIMVIYGLFVLFYIIPKAYLIKNYSYNDSTALSESNIAKHDDKYYRVEFEKRGSESEMSTIKFQDGVEKAKLRRGIPKDKNNALWPQNVNNFLEIKYERKKRKKVFRKQYMKRSKKVNYLPKKFKPVSWKE